MKTKIKIIVSGGFVSDVFASDAVDVDVIDLDVVKEEEGSIFADSLYDKIALDKELVEVY